MAEEMQSLMARVLELEEEMDGAGAFVLGGALHGPDAATVVSGGTGMDKVAEAIDHAIEVRPFRATGRVRHHGAR